MANSDSYLSKIYESKYCCLNNKYYAQVLRDRESLCVWKDERNKHTHTIKGPVSLHQCMYSFTICGDTHKKEKKHSKSPAVWERDKIWLLYTN